MGFMNWGWDGFCLLCPFFWGGGAATWLDWWLDWIWTYIFAMRSFFCNFKSFSIVFPRVFVGDCSFFFRPKRRCLSELFYLYCGRKVFSFGQHIRSFDAWTVALQFSRSLTSSGPNRRLYVGLVEPTQSPPSNTAGKLDPDGKIQCPDRKEMAQDHPCLRSRILERAVHVDALEIALIHVIILCRYSEHECMIDLNQGLVS